jgi:protein-disulfide isomerase
LWSKQPRVDLGIPADGAKVIVVKFNDWQCPSCKMAHEAYKPVLEKYAKEKPGAVKYVLKDYPLNTKCNFQLPSNFPGHAGACEAAVAVRLARAKGPEKEDALVTWLLGNQETLTPATVKSAVERLAGVTDFDTQYPIVINDVKRDINDGGVLQVGFTPTFYINGVKANTADGRWLPAEYFDMILQYEISRSEKAGK